MPNNNSSFCLLKIEKNIKIFFNKKSVLIFVLKLYAELGYSKGIQAVL